MIFTKSPFFVILNDWYNIIVAFVDTKITINSKKQISRVVFVAILSGMSFWDKPRPGGEVVEGQATAAV